MTQDRAGHNGEREAGAEPRGRRKQNQNRRDQFGNAGTKATPRFESDFAEDINGFRRGREFEKQCLQENHRSRDAANPGDDYRCFAGVIHKGFFVSYFVEGEADSLQRLDAKNLIAVQISRRVHWSRSVTANGNHTIVRSVIAQRLTINYEANPFPCAHLAVAARPSRESAITGEESSDS